MAFAAVFGVLDDKKDMTSMTFVGLAEYNIALSLLDGLLGLVSVTLQQDNDIAI